MSMNHTKNDNARTTFIQQAASLIAMALAPLAVVIGIAVLSAPSADAGSDSALLKDLTINRSPVDDQHP